MVYDSPYIYNETAKTGERKQEMKNAIFVLHDPRAVGSLLHQIQFQMCLPKATYDWWLGVFLEMCLCITPGKD